MENGILEQIVTHLERALELHGLEAFDELQINTLSQHATNTNADRTNRRATTVKKTGHYRNQGRQLNKEKEQARGF